MFWKKVFRKTWQNSRENNFHEVIFVKLFTKVYWKEDSITDAALSWGLHWEIYSTFSLTPVLLAHKISMQWHIKNKYERHTIFSCSARTVHNTLFLTSSQKICIDQKRIFEIMYHRSIHPEVFCNKGALRNFVAKFTGKHLCQSLFFYKVAGFQVFSYEFCKIC